MTARFPLFDVIVCGQSQSIMFMNRGGQQVDAGLTISGLDKLAADLTALVPDATVFVGPAGSGTTAHSDSPLFEEFRGAASEAFFNGSPFSNRAKGTAQRNYINGRAAANKAGVVLVYQHTQDSGTGATDNDFIGPYATFAAAYIDALIADAATAGWGDFAILPVLAAARSTSGSSTAKWAAYRNTWRALAGQIPWQGIARRPQVLTPVSVATSIAAAEWAGGGDFTHVTTSTDHRVAETLAIRLAGWIGKATPVADQPRLARAVLTTPTTLVAYIALGSRAATFQHQPSSATTGRFSLSTGTITAISAPDNSFVATTGYARLTLTVSGVSAGARLRYAEGFNGASFVNGSTPPRGNLRNGAWAVTGTTLGTVTDAAEDANPAAGHILSMGNDDFGVPVEIAP